MFHFLFSSSKIDVFGLEYSYSIASDRLYVQRIIYPAWVGGGVSRPRRQDSGRRTNTLSSIELVVETKGHLSHYRIDRKP